MYHILCCMISEGFQLCIKIKAFMLITIPICDSKNTNVNNFPALHFPQYILPCHHIIKHKKARPEHSMEQELKGYLIIIAELHLIQNLR